METNVMGNQYNREQIKKSRKCNILQSKVSQAASKADSAQGDVFHGSEQIAQCQLTTTRASNVAGNSAANPRNQIAACQSIKTMETNIAGNRYIGEEIAKSRKCSVSQSKISQADSKADSTQVDVFHTSNQIAQSQSN
jgi:hypothetical protein